jgi:hypothetical protein
MYCDEVVWKLESYILQTWSYYLASYIVSFLYYLEGLANTPLSYASIS